MKLTMEINQNWQLAVRLGGNWNIDLPIISFARSEAVDSVHFRTGSLQTSSMSPQLVWSQCRRGQTWRKSINRADNRAR